MKKISYLLTLLLTANIIFFTSCSDNDPVIEVITATGVTLNHNTLELPVDGRQTLSATVTPTDAVNRDVVWSSSAPAIATVTDGEVIAVAEGEATITVTTVCGGHKATATVTVFIPAVQVTGVTVAPATLEIEVGDTYTLIATVAPANADITTVVWSTIDATVATVVNGVVTAVGAGYATITVTTVCGEFTAETEVTVYIIPVTGITLDKDVLNLEVGETATLTATVTPDDATNPAVEWTSSAPTVASVSNIGVVTAAGTGTATITATTVCGELTAEVTVTVIAVTVVDQTEEGVVIAGVRWATRNVAAPGYFAAAAYSRGLFYQWNRTMGWFPDPASEVANPPVLSTDGSTWDTTNAAPDAEYWIYGPCPAGWRMPTRAELEALRDGESALIENWNDTGVDGRLFGTYPYQIFLPIWGHINWGWGLLAFPANAPSTAYWSNQRTVGSTANAPALQFNIRPTVALQFGIANLTGIQGNLVRCVAID